MHQVPAKKKVGIIGCTGDRRDQDITQMAMYAAESFDEIIIRHDKDGRGRTDEELTKLILDGIRRVKPQADPVIISDELKALSFAIQQAGAGTFIMLAADDARKSIEFLKGIKHNESHPMSMEL